MVSQVPLGATASDLLVAAFGLRGDERKNFVPVDWVSAVMCHIHGQSECHGKTYHVTSPHPTLLIDMATAMQEVVEAMSPVGDPDLAGACDGAWFEKTFREQLTIYGAYWRDDPTFDATHTLEAAPHLPCPPMDRETMTRLARYAIESNFGRVRHPRCKVDIDVHGHLRRLLRAGAEIDPADAGFAHLGIEVNGPGGGQWELLVRDGRPVAADEGVGVRSTAVFKMTSGVFRRMVDGELAAAQAVKQGHVSIEGNGMDRGRLEAVLQAVATAPAGVARP